MGKSLLIYGDESCHLRTGIGNYMVIGVVCCEEQNKNDIVFDIRNIIEKYGYNKFSEIKWKKVSPRNVKMYQEILNYFHENDGLFYRSIVIEKKQIDWHEEDFYGKMYYQLLKYIILNNHETYFSYDKYKVYMDISDTIGAKRVHKLQDFFMGQLRRSNVSRDVHIQEIRSTESPLLQLADIISGAIQYVHRDEYNKNKPGKSQLVNWLENTYNIFSTTYKPKVNVFYWKGGKYV